MRIAGGILIIVVSWLCMFSGGCNLVGAGLTRGATMAEEKITKTIKDKGGGSITAEHKQLLSKLRELVQAVVGGKEGRSGTLFLLAGALSLLGGLLAFAGGILLLVNMDRGFVIVSIVIALAGTGLGFMTPLSSTYFTVAKVVMLVLGLLAALMMKSRQAAGVSHAT